MSDSKDGFWKLVSNAKINMAISFALFFCGITSFIFVATLVEYDPINNIDNYYLLIFLSALGVVLITLAAIALVLYYRAREKEICEQTHEISIKKLKEIFEKEYEIKQANRFRDCQSCGKILPKESISCRFCGR